MLSLPVFPWKESRKENGFKLAPPGESGPDAVKGTPAAAGCQTPEFRLFRLFKDKGAQLCFLAEWLCAMNDWESHYIVTVGTAE